MSHIQTILHASVLVADLDAALAFYTGVLGLQINAERPDLGFDGAWLEVGAGQQIHLLALPNPDPVSDRPEHPGRDRHTALSVRDLDLFAARLEAAGIPFTRSRSGRRALFARDPDGNGIELVEVAEFPVL